MSDLIDRQEAIDAIYENEFSNWCDKDEVSTILNDLPSADAVEVVRCKDCINFTKGKDEWGSCFENPLKMWRDTDYCSWGERKDDGV